MSKYAPKSIVKNIYTFVISHPLLVSLMGWLILTVIGAVIFYLRFPYTYSYPNFYAEDGTILVKNVLTEGPLVGMFSLFNGYLVLGQYLVTEAAFLVNAVFGSGFHTLPKAIAIVSYTFWGAVTSLPFLLFRKQLGVPLAVITVAFLYIVPLGGYDYATIGTIGNLKFAFFFIATLLVLYRNQTDLVTKRWQFFVIDAALLLCVFTNIIVVALLPFVFWRYREALIAAIKRKRIAFKGWKVEHYSAIGLLAIAFVYPIALYLRGLPSMEGYLDEPLQPEALLDILYRGSIYGITFPLNPFINDIIVLLMFVLIALAITFSKYKTTLLFLGYAILINVLGFALTRPGITHLFNEYTLDGGPGLFFYAGTLLFVFGLAYAFKDWFKKLTVLQKSAFASIALLFVLIAAPASGVRDASYNSILLTRPNVYQEVDRVCRNATRGDSVEIGIYPAPNWTLTLPSDQICAKW